MNGFTKLLPVPQYKVFALDGALNVLDRASGMIYHNLKNAKDCSGAQHFFMLGRDASGSRVLRIFLHHTLVFTGAV